MTSDRTHYAKLMEKWRDAEALAELIRKFADGGGRHRLKVKVEHTDPIIAGNAERFINDMMNNHGFGQVVQQAMEKAERLTEKAKEAFLQQAGSDYLQP